MIKSSFTIIGHRGAAGTAPENTLASIQTALSRGVQYIEVDVQRSRDGVLTLMHDRTVDRTTNGRGPVVELDWSRLQALDAGSKFSEKFANECVPSLESALRLICQAGAVLIIEVKYPALYPGLASDLNELIQSLNASGHVIVMSFDIQFMSELARLQPDFPLGCLYVFPPQPTANELSFSQCISVYWHSARFFPKRLQRIRERGVITWAWTVNRPKMIKKVMDWGFNGVVTDFP